MVTVMRWLRQPKLWVTLASLAFIAVALVQQAGQLRQQSLAPWGGGGWDWAGRHLDQHPRQCLGLAGPARPFGPRGWPWFRCFCAPICSNTCRAGFGIWWSG